MRLSVAGREQQKNTNYAFRALRAVQLLSQVCGITATQAVRGDSGGLMQMVMRAYDVYEVCLLLTEARVLRMVDLRQVRSLYALVRRL